MRPLLSVQEASAFLGVSQWTLYRWARRGRIASVQLGRRRLFAEEDLQAVISAARRASSVNATHETSSKRETR